MSTRIREELELAINGSLLFSIDRAANKELFIAVEMQLIKDIADLMKIVLSREHFAERGLEIIETAKACIKAYKTDCGPFLHYFNASLKKTLFIAEAKEKANEHRGGILIDEKTDRLIRKILKYADACGDKINDFEFQKRIAEKLDVSFESVRDVIEINDNAAAQSGDSSISNEDCDGSKLFDNIAAAIESAEERAEKLEFVREIIVSIDAAFKGQQERTKPLLAKLLTIRFIEALDDVSHIGEIAREQTFLDADICSDYKKRGKIPTAREIAAIFGVHEASASRTLKTFLEKIPRKC
ncbi:MAG: hypothetical protein LBB56_05900 [Chitinispirillales bacterium]|jgi:hypothetical protein|nr:hypothetical protein [Chitinispirillales bacterium]